MIYTVTLNPAIDYVVRLEGPLVPGTINRSTAESIQFGGKGINVSNVLRTLGVQTTALGFIAGFTGQALAEGLAAMGLSTRFIPVAKGMTRINAKIKGGEETEINGMGPDITDRELQALYGQLDSLTCEDMLVLSGSVPGCLPEDIYGQILARLQDRKIPVAVDTSGKQLLNVLPYRPFLIKPNNHELGALFGTTPETDDEILSCAGKLQEKGGRNILVSLAGNGALLLDETGKVHRIGCPKGPVVNSVGAGDSMVAGFLAGWLKTGDYGYALKLGTAAGSATAFSLGLGEKARIDALLETL